MEVKIFTNSHNETMDAMAQRVNEWLSEQAGAGADIVTMTQSECLTDNEWSFTITFLFRPGVA